MNLRVVLYTAITGGYDTPKLLPPGLTCDTVLFTDVPGVHAPGWDVRQVDISHLVPILRHKYIKLQPDVWLPEYDVALWVDGSVTIMRDDYAELCVAALGDADIALTPHPHRKCIYDEAACITALRQHKIRSMPDVIPQVNCYRELEHPSNWGLFASGVNARRIHSRGSIMLGQMWWDEIVSWTYRDQMSLPVVMRRLGTDLRWNANLPWGKWWKISEHKGV